MRINACFHSLKDDAYHFCSKHFQMHHTQSLISQALQTSKTHPSTAPQATLVARAAKWSSAISVKGLVSTAQSQPLSLHDEKMHPTYVQLRLLFCQPPMPPKVLRGAGVYLHSDHVLKCFQQRNVLCKKTVAKAGTLSLSSQGFADYCMMCWFLFVCHIVSSCF